MHPILIKPSCPTNGVRSSFPLPSLRVLSPPAHHIQYFTAVRYATSSYQPFATCHLPFAICHLPFAICHLPFAICHLPFAICHLPFAICHYHPPCATHRCSPCPVKTHTGVNLPRVKRAGNDPALGKCPGVDGPTFLTHGLPTTCPDSQNGKCRQRLPKLGQAEPRSLALPVKGRPQEEATPITLPAAKAWFTTGAGGETWAGQQPRTQAQQARGFSIQHSLTWWSLRGMPRPPRSFLRKVRRAQAMGWVSKRIPKRRAGGVGHGKRPPTLLRLADPQGLQLSQPPRSAQVLRVWEN